jgi:hypothetical protein
MLVDVQSKMKSAFHVKDHEAKKKKTYDIVISMKLEDKQIKNVLIVKINEE